jgi:alpha-L-fucosidase
LVMEERLTQIGDWLRPNGDAIYGTSAWVRPTQWSRGTVPHMEQKEFRAEYDITRLVDNPPAGFATVEAFFTMKGDTVFAILPRWPNGQIELRNVAAPSGSRIELLETHDELQWHAQGNNLLVTLPGELRSRLPARQAYILKMTGVKSV